MLVRETGQEIMAAEMRFWSVAQSTTDAIISADHRGSIIFWNKGAIQMFGYSEQEALRQPLTILIPEQYREAHTQGMERLNQSGEPHVMGRTVELHAQHKDGRIFPIELTLSSWAAAEGVFYNGIIRDISRRKQAEEALHNYAKELEERNRELDAYSRTIAHDLKAPLNLVLGYASLLEKKHHEILPDEAITYLLRIKDSSHRMSQMIDQLLHLAQLRHAIASCFPIDVHQAARSAASRYQHTIEQEQIAVEIASALPRAMGHGPWIEEILANLIGNAIKYRGQQNPSPRIEIRAVPDTTHIRYEVKDNGIGIPQESQATLFEMFTRVHSEEAEGFGLGLSIVHRIVTRLNGQVGVESAPGQGSTFWFTLPAVNQPAVSA